MIQHISRLRLPVTVLLVGGIALFAIGCSEDFGIDEIAFSCSSNADCSDGYTCQERADGKQACMLEGAASDAGDATGGTDATDAPDTSGSPDATDVTDTSDATDATDATDTIDAADTSDTPTPDADADECGLLDDEFGSGEDTNCDGVDGVRSEALFVAPNGNDAASGDPSAPLADPQFAVEKAKIDGISVIVLAEGAYQTALNIDSAISVYGGYDRQTWLGGGTPSTLEPSGSDETIVVDRSADRSTEAKLVNLVVHGPSTGVVDASVAVRLQHIDSGGLSIIDTTIHGGVGANGQAVNNGADGASGGDGVDGTDAHVVYTFDQVNQGPDGGQASCQHSIDGGAGGKGGDSHACSSQGGHGDDGGVGTSLSSGAVGGSGGAGADDGCYNSSSDGGSGDSGGDGTSGEGGRSGTDVDQTLGHFSTGDEWSAAISESGAPGLAGAGGGGGGAGQSNQSSSGTSNIIGGTGGSGGAGGCGGQGGPAGSPGGASIGVLLFDADVSFERAEIVIGRGGDGADGADGGCGGAGGSGGNGGASSTAGGGGNGGDGGHGGNGGGGAGGHGGPAIGLALVSASNIGGVVGTDVTFDTGNAAGGAGGSGGSGTHCANGIADHSAGDGDSGLASDVYETHDFDN